MFSPKSDCDDVTMYRTAMGDADGSDTDAFGNLSAISKTEVETQEDPLIDFRMHLSSISLNSRTSMLSRTEELTPGEKLIKAMHTLARYRGVWGIYEDESQIVKHVGKLNELLSSCDDSTVQKACEEDEYQEVKGLVSYFVLEKRFVVRSDLLLTFTLLVQKSAAIAEYIFASEFPMVLAWEIVGGNYVSRETYDYAYCFLQVISATRLSRLQCESIGIEFYSQILGMMNDADKNHYGQVAELFFDIILHFHAQLEDESEFKWKSLRVAASPENRAALKKFKYRIMGNVTKNASIVSSLDPDQSMICERKMKELLVVLKDLIICNSTKWMFSSAEYDDLLVTLTNTLEESQSPEYNLNALKTIYRTLLTASSVNPRSLNKLCRLVKRLMDQQEENNGAGDNHISCYRGILKKIHKVITM